MTLAHPNIIHQEINGKRLYVWLNIDPDPEAPNYDEETIFDIVERARVYMKEKALKELVFEKTTRH
jgi:hypothetical protein